MNFSKLSKALAHPNPEEVVSIDDWWTQSLEELPEGIGRFTNLQRLGLRKLNFKTLPESMCNLQKLEHLRLCDIPLQEFPEVLSRLPALEELHLKNCALNSLPECVGKLSKLRILNVENNNLLSLPESIADLKQLMQLNFRSNQIKYVPLSYQRLPDQARIAFWDNPDLSLENLKMEGAEKLRTKIIESILNEFTPSWGYEHQNSWFRKHKTKLISILQERIPGIEYSNNPLQKESELVLVGKSALPISELKERLKKQDINYSTKVGASTTHVVLGRNIKRGMYKGSEQQEVSFISEKNLLAFLESKEDRYITDNPATQDANIDQLESLMQSPDEDNVQLALHLMKAGGVPADLLEALFVTYKTSRKASVRTLARHLLKVHLPEQEELISSRMPLKQYGENVIGPNIYWLTKNTPLNDLKVARILFQKTGDGWSYLLNNGKVSDKKLVIENDLKEETLDWSYRNRMRILPLELADYPQLKKLILSRCGFKRLPEVICRLSNLEELDLSGNSIVKLPDCFAALTNLKSIKLKWNRFRTFPEVLLKLPNLEYIDFLSEEYKYRYLKTPSWDAIHAALPKCQLAAKESFMR